mgnify:CR=1 FL=1
MSNLNPHTHSPRPGEAERSVYLIQSRITTGLHKELAINELDAFGHWTRQHGIDRRVQMGVIQQEPFRHLSIWLTDGCYPDLHVVAERVLEAGGSLLDLSDIDSGGGHDE